MSEELRVVDGIELPEEYRQIYRPAEIATAADGLQKQLPRFFYEVPSKEAAWNTYLTPHFALGELLRIDLKEEELLRDYPRHVPCAIRVLATYLERFRDLCEAPVYISVNGGYRSVKHQGNRSLSPHSWGAGVDIYRIGSTMLDSQESIETYREKASRLGAEVTVYPYGHGPGEVDDHLHFDLGYLHLVPPEVNDDGRVPESAAAIPERRSGERRESELY